MFRNPAGIAVLSNCSGLVHYSLKNKHGGKTMLVMLTMGSFHGKYLRGERVGVMGEGNIMKNKSHVTVTEVGK